MKIAISGATGMIGSRLVDYLLSQGHQIAVMSRRASYHQSQLEVILWDPAINYLDAEKLEGFDVIIHLAGSSVSENWSLKNKQSIRDSRVLSTRLLCGALKHLNIKPKLLIAASAIGYYGNHAPEKILDEQSPSGQGFLADVCRQWEEEALQAQRLDIRVVYLRLGVVLSKTGGAIAKMWLPFQLGIGGRLGLGKQMMSWVALDEIPYVVEHIIKNESIKGAVNMVSPKAVSNAEFTNILGQVIGRPTFLPVPAFVIRLLFGEMGQNLLLEGANVIPRRLQESRYKFRYPDLKEALKQCLI